MSVIDSATPDPSASAKGVRPTTILYFFYRRKEMNCRVEQRESKKTGKPYFVVIVTFPNGYEKYVFLDKAEEFMVADLIG